MNLFTDARIATRLSVGFGIILGLMCTVVITGLFFFGSVADKSIAITTARIVFVALGILTLTVGVCLSRATTKSITIPINRSSAHIDLMAKGDFSIPVSQHALRRRDEMGVFAKSMDAMNLHLSETLKEIVSSAMQVASASSQLSTSAQALATGATSQVDRTNQSASGASQLNQAGDDIARSSTAVASSANDAVNVAKGGREVVARTIDEVRLIAETVESASGFVKELGIQSDKIGSIVTTINDIADQTNLLALNAAIEAARAGEHGRGFAVVADEVKKLAERTSASTTEISAMLEQIRMGVQRTVESMGKAQGKVTTGVELSSKTSDSLEQIITRIDTLYGGVHQIATAIKQMNVTTNEITEDLKDISAVTKDAFASSEDISAAAGNLTALSKNLESIARGFKV